MKETIKLGKNDAGDWLLEFHCATSIHHFILSEDAAENLARAILAESQSLKRIVPANVVDLTKIRKPVVS